MADPTKYSPSYSFTGFQAQNPDSPIPAPQVDNELANVAVSVGEAIDAVKDIRRSDGALRNQVVTPDSLSAATRALLTREINPRGQWASGTAYAAKDAVVVEGATYLCAAAHTSGTDFAADMSVGKWLLLASPYSISGAVYSEVFSGNGTQTVFALGQEFQSISDLQVYVQNGTAGYELVRGVGTSPQVSLTSPTQITFASAPGLGTRNIIVMAVNQSAASSAAAAAASEAAAAASEAAAAASEANALASEGAAGNSATAAAASEAAAQTARLAAEAAANNIAVRDVVFKTASDSPISVDQTYGGKMIAIDTSGGPVTVNLAAIASLTLPFGVALKKTTGDANAVTINRGGSDTIDGATTKVIATLAGTHLYPDVDPAPDRWVSADFGATAGNMTDETFVAGVNFTAGVTTSLTLSQNYVSAANIQVHFDAAYVGADEIALSGTTLTFPGFPGGAIPSGVGKVYVKGGSSLSVGVPADGSVSTAKLADSAATTAKLADGAVTFAKLASASVASQAEAEAGSAVDKLMTPQRVAQAIAAQTEAFRVHDMDLYLRLAVYQSLGAGGFVNGAYDAFNSGTTLASSTGGTYDSSNKLWWNPATSTTLTASMLSISGGLAIQGGGPVGTLIDGNFSTTNGLYLTGSGNGRIIINYGSPVTLSSIGMYGWGTDGNGTWKVQYSDDGSTWTDTGKTVVSAASSWVDNATISSGSHQYWCLFAQYPGSSNGGIVEIRATAGSDPVQMTLVSAALSPAAAPARVLAQLWWAPGTSGGTLNADLILEVTRDGATWTAAPLADSGIDPVSGFNLLTAAADLAAQPAGTALQWRLRTTAKPQKVKGVALAWS